MKIIKKYRLIFLILVSFVFCTLLSVISDVIATLIVFFKINRFIFSWNELLFNVVDRTPVPGVILGVGLWIKNKLQERENKDKTTK
ncbi:hypothetical protein LQ939_08170 [Pantoea alhagi]|uniref:hypothetical protein n=1 Tax=Pantoea alhagi TaxID=1891675 RepID=UPI00202AE7B6|nr:hypothetical protein [Pantoea alhagi]URQ62210.1 hypothetical protein LQ939_08170 [Pantoea alhagi]